VTLSSDLVSDSGGIASGTMGTGALGAMKIGVG